MIINRQIHRVNAANSNVPSNNFLKGRVGFWGIVIEQNSLNNTVTIVSDTGVQYTNVPVYSREWVTVDDNKNYIPSQRNLPPVNSWVFVLTPTFSGAGAFVLCSGFTRGDENIRKLWAQSDSEVKDKNNSRELKTQGGWDITEEYANGNYSVKSNDEAIIFIANTTQDDNKSQNKEISLKAWDNIITINEDGITVTDLNGNTVSATDGGISAEDTNENKIEMTSSGISVTDKNGNSYVNDDSGITITDTNDNEIEMTSSGIKITDKNNNTYTSSQNSYEIKIGNGKITVANNKTTINGHLEVSV